MFRFEQPYVATIMGDTFPPLPCVGLRRLRLRDPWTREEGSVAWRFQIPDLNRPSVTVFGDVVSTFESGTVLVQARSIKDDAGQPVVWRFVPMTAERANALALPDAPTFQTSEEVEVWMEDLLHTIQPDEAS